MYHYVYITTNLKNGKLYVGDHSTDNLDDGYLGSGKPAFNNAKKKYGKENFKKEIIEFFDTKKEAFDAQEKYIKEYKTLISENGYNISPSGGTRFNGLHSLESRKKISDSIKGENHPFFGKNHTEDAKNKQRINRSGGREKGSFMPEMAKKEISINLLGRIPWNKGLKMSDEFKEKTKKGILEKRSFNENYLNRYKK